MPPNVLFQLGLATRDGARRTCTVCKKWKDKWPATNIMNHFKHNHPTEYVKAKKRQQEKHNDTQQPSKKQRTDDDDKSQITETSSSQSSSRQILVSPVKSSSIIDHIAKANSSAVIEKITLAFVMNNIPHHVINNHYFIDMLKSIISCGQTIKIPERHRLRDYVEQLGLQIKQVSHVTWRISYVTHMSHATWHVLHVARKPRMCSLVCPTVRILLLLLLMVQQTLFMKKL